MMKNINLDKIDDLLSLKENLIKTIDNRINEAKQVKAVKDIDKLNIGELKYLFESVSNDLYDTKNGKQILKKYVTLIRENKSLKNFYCLYETIKNANNVSDLQVFLNESIKLKKNISNNELKSLKNIVKEGVKASKLTDNNISELMNNYNNSIDKPLSYILSENKTHKNVLEYSNNVSSVMSLLENTNIKKENSDTLGKEEMLESLRGQNWNNFSKWEQNVLKDVSLYTLSGKEQPQLFEDYKNDCLDIINESLKDCETVEEKNRFENLRTKLAEKVYNADTFSNDIMKLSELKETLNN